MGALYALVLFIQTELMGNIYRITRVTNLPISTVNITISIIILIVFIISTINFFFISAKYLNIGKLRYFLTLLWIPYYVIFTSVFSFLLPMTYRGDEPAPVTGLILIGILLVSPIYIAFITAISKR